jgi:hypothetical protein
VVVAQAADMGDGTEPEAVPHREPTLPPKLETTPGLRPGQRSTRHLIERAVQRLIRAGGRKTEAEAAHLLEGIGIIAYDPSSETVDPELPAPGSGLRWEEFVDALAICYEARFEA